MPMEMNGSIRRAQWLQWWPAQRDKGTESHLGAHRMAQLGKRSIDGSDFGVGRVAINAFMHLECGHLRSPWQTQGYTVTSRLFRILALKTGRAYEPASWRPSAHEPRLGESNATLCVTMLSCGRKQRLNNTVPQSKA